MLLQPPREIVSAWLTGTVSRYNWSSCTSITWCSLYHQNLLAYSFLRACQDIGALFHHFNVCGKECQPVNEELAKQAGFRLQNAMQYLLRHSEQLPDGRGELKGKNHYLFMCRSDLTMMFHAVADNYRELGERRAPGRNLSLVELENQMAQNLHENSPDTAALKLLFGQEVWMSVSCVLGRGNGTAKLHFPFNWPRGNGSRPSAT